MFNLNDPKLTKQEREFILSLQTDKELEKKVVLQKKDGNNICFPSFWVVQTKDLIKFNKGAHQIDTSFDFYAEELEKHHPDFDCLLFEGERVEIGEWDKTYKRWSSHSYQRVGVIWIDGKFHSIEDGNIAVNQLGDYDTLLEHHIDKYIDGLIKKIEETGITALQEELGEEITPEDKEDLENVRKEITPEELEELRNAVREELVKDENYEKEKQKLEDWKFQYPYSFSEHPLQWSGVIDIPLHLLNEYEEKRVFDYSFFISKKYEKVIEAQLKNKEDFIKGRNQTKKKIKKFKNSTRNKKSFRKSFGGGFGQ